MPRTEVAEAEDDEAGLIALERRSSLSLVFLMSKMSDSSEQVVMELILAFLSFHI